MGTITPHQNKTGSNGNEVGTPQKLELLHQVLLSVLPGTPFFKGLNTLLGIQLSYSMPCCNMKWFFSLKKNLSTIMSNDNRVCDMCIILYFTINCRQKLRISVNIFMF